MSANVLSNAELLKRSLLTEARLRWLIRKLQDKNIITEEEFEEIWHSWDEEGQAEMKDKERQRAEAAGVK